MVISKCVYIIILNYKGYNDTLECIESIYCSSYTNFYVVVCDNSSPNESEKKIMEWKEKNQDKPFKYIQTGNNYGFAGGNNIGIKYALSKDADYVWLLNNDTVIRSDTLVELLKKAESNARIGVCGSKLMCYDRKDKVQGLAGKYNPFTGRAGHILKEQELYKMKYVIGASMLIKRQVLEDIGLLSERYFLYFEELDYAERMKKKYELAIALRSIVYHREGASIGNGDAFSSYYLFRSGLIFSKKYYRLCFPVVFIITFFRIMCPWKIKKYNRFEMIKRLL